MTTAIKCLRNGFITSLIIYILLSVLAISLAWFGSGLLGLLLFVHLVLSNAIPSVMELTLIVALIFYVIKMFKRNEE